MNSERKPRRAWRVLSVLVTVLTIGLALEPVQDRLGLEPGTRPDREEESGWIYAEATISALYTDPGVAPLRMSFLQRGPNLHMMRLHTDAAPLGEIVLSNGPGRGQSWLSRGLATSYYFGRSSPFGSRAVTYGLGRDYPGYRVVDWTDLATKAGSEVIAGRPTTIYTFSLFIEQMVEPSLDSALFSTSVDYTLWVDEEEDAILKVVYDTGGQVPGSYRAEVTHVSTETPDLDLLFPEISWPQVRSAPFQPWPVLGNVLPGGSPRLINVPWAFQAVVVSDPSITGTRIALLQSGGQEQVTVIAEPLKSEIPLPAGTLASIGLFFGTYVERDDGYRSVTWQYWTSGWGTVQMTLISKDLSMAELLSMATTQP